MQEAQEPAKLCARLLRACSSRHIPPHRYDSAALGKGLSFDIGRNYARETAAREPPGDIDGGGDTGECGRVGRDPDQQPVVRKRETRIAVQAEQLGVADGDAKAVTDRLQDRVDFLVEITVLCHGDADFPRSAGTNRHDRAGRFEEVPDGGGRLVGAQDSEDPGQLKTDAVRCDLAENRDKLAARIAG